MPVSRPKSLPRRFRRMRVLIVGCGDVGLRLIDQFSDRANIMATARRDDQCAAIRRRRARPVRFDLDAPDRPAETLAPNLIYMAPPAATSDDTDPRLTASLSRAAAKKRRLVYTSTSGVFGDARGAWLTETSPARPANARALRRLAAERLLRQQNRHGKLAASIFRVPGIYAADRLPLQRFERESPAIVAEQDSYSNHINADDLARILWLALFRARTSRLYITSDGEQLKMGDYFDQVADTMKLSRPTRYSAQEVRDMVSPMLWSFMSESRRLSNKRLQQEMRITLTYPTVADTLKAVSQPSAKV